jgi:hypothetical protein
MYPNSTKKGTFVVAFPDSCFTPSPGGPVPVPYPNTARTLQATLPPALVAAGISVAGSNYKQSGSAVAQTLRSRLSQLNNQLLTLPGSDPNHWHTLVDEYVQTTASLYKTLASSKVV